MKKLIILTTLVLFSIACIDAQTRPAPPKRAKPAPTVPAAVTEIAEYEWNLLARTLKAEDWTRAAALAGEHLKSLKKDNDKKQLAQLRYIYLYALAGRIHAFNTQKNALEAERAWAELDNTLAAYTGQEVLLPPRQFETNCAGKLNFICTVKDNPRAFRTTATNKEGSAIHSFDYVLFDHDLDIKEFRGKDVFVGGILRKAEFNDDVTKPWVMRLFFNKGFVRVAVR